MRDKIVTFSDRGPRGRWNTIDGYIYEMLDIRRSMRGRLFSLISQHRRLIVDSSQGRRGFSIKLRNVVIYVKFDFAEWSLTSHEVENLHSLGVRAILKCLD